MTNDEQFYNQVAKHIGKKSLNDEESTTTFRARLAAVKSFEQHGATVSPSPDLVYSVSWYLTQSRLAEERAN